MASQKAQRERSLPHSIFAPHLVRLSELMAT